jgi:RimJ/RimL family protein N-acetyltransferase
VIGPCTAPRIETERLLLRRWEVSDAAALGALLVANVEHLRPWIPWAVAEPAPVPALEQRLLGYANAFDENRHWLYAIATRDDATLLGGIGLYPRNAMSRVPATDADRAEVGYWLRQDFTGRGYVTESAQAMVSLAGTIARFRTVEMRCDPRNTSSIAVPRRLGFHHTGTERVQTPGGAEVTTSIWTIELPRSSEE